MPFFVYILQSQKDLSFYIGFTANLQQRLRKHNNARTGYSASKKPWNIVYFESFDNKSDALKRERFLKNQKNRNFYSRLIENFNSF